MTRGHLPHDSGSLSVCDVSWRWAMPGLELFNGVLMIFPAIAVVVSAFNVIF